MSNNYQITMKKEIKYVFLFITVTLIVSWTYALFVFSSPKTLPLFNFVMLVPATVAIILNSIKYKSFKLVMKPLFSKISLKSILFASLYPLLFISLLALVVYLLGAATYNIDKLSSGPSIQFGVLFIVLFLASIILTFGEEYGWRGFLLKELAEIKGRVFAAIVVGIVWAVWHAPFVYGLAYYGKMEHPALLMLIQMGAVFVFSFPFAYSYFLTNSIVPPILLHLIWNIFNPIVLGNIYRNKPGIMDGNLLYINGEGLGGMILGLLIMFWFLSKFKNSPKLTS